MRTIELTFRLGTFTFHSSSVDYAGYFGGLEASNCLNREFSRCFLGGHSSAGCVGSSKFRQIIARPRGTRAAPKSNIFLFGRY